MFIQYEKGGVSLILWKRRIRRVLKISSVRNFNVYRNNIAIMWRNATKMPVQLLDWRSTQERNRDV